MQVFKDLKLDFHRKFASMSITPCQLKYITPHQVMCDALSEVDLHIDQSLLDVVEFELTNTYESVEAPSCRICWEESNRSCNIDERLISPCVCSGSMHYIHVKCLKRLCLQDIVNSSVCPTCKTEYYGKHALIVAHHYLTEYGKRTNLTLKEVAELFMVIGNLLCKGNRLNEAEYFFSKYIYLSKSIFYETHRNVAFGYKCLAEVVYKQQRHGESKEYLKRALDMFLKHYGSKFHEVEEIRLCLLAFAPNLSINTIV